MTSQGRRPLRSGALGFLARSLAVVELPRSLVSECELGLRTWGFAHVRAAPERGLKLSRASPASGAFALSGIRSEWSSGLPNWTSLGNAFEYHWAGLCRLGEPSP